MRRSTVLITVACLIAGSCIFPAPWARASQAKEQEALKERALGVSHYIMGLVYDLQGRVIEATNAYERSVRSQESEFAPHLRLGANYARLGRYPDALHELGIASKLDPEDLQSHYFMAQVYAAQNDVVSAAEEYEIILKSFYADDPQDPELLSYLGQLYYSQGKIDKALQKFEKVYALQPQNVDVAYLLGNFYLEQDRMDEAEKVFRSALEVDPQHDGCLNALGYSYAEAGKNLEEAKELILRALELSPNDPAYIDSLGWLYYKQGNYVEAIEQLTRAREMLDDPVISDHLGDVYFKLGRVDMAKKFWRASLDLYPDQEKVKEKLRKLEPAQALERSQKE